jgi:hypothetical protein
MGLNQKQTDGIEFILKAAPAGPYSYPVSCYAPPPFADMTAAAKLFPQTLLASLEFPPLYDVVDMQPFMSSGLETFATVNHANNLNNSSSLDSNIDYHSLDYIFDSFNTAYGFLDNA